MLGAHLTGIYIYTYTPSPPVHDGSTCGPIIVLHYSIIMITNNHYNIVAAAATITSRLSRGQAGALKVEGTWDGHNWLSKIDLPGTVTDPKGRPLVYREWTILRALQGTGLVPTVDESVDPSEEGYMFISCVNNAATIGDYTQAYLNGIIPIEVLRELLELTSNLVEEFHSMGWCHNDLHSNNIVIGHSRHSWEVYIIDVAVATRNNRVPTWLEREFIIEDEPEADIARLTGDISAIAEGCPDPVRVEELNHLLSKLF
jgi:serine/threonine protein kinase